MFQEIYIIDCGNELAMLLREKFEILFNEKERLKNPEVDLAIKESGKSDDYLKTLSNFIISCKRQNNQDRYDLLT